MEKKVLIFCAEHAIIQIQRLQKYCKKHSAPETTNFIFVILCSTMQTVVDSLPDTQPQSRTVICCEIFRSCCDQQLWKIIFYSGVAVIRPKTFATPWIFVLKFGIPSSTNLL